MTVNRALDPSLEVVSGVSSSANYVLSNDPTVKFAGTRSRKTTRAATAPSNIVGAVHQSVTTLTGAGAVLVAPGEVISLSSKVRMDRPGRVKLDVSFRDNANVTLGGIQAGPYTDAPTPGEWYTAKSENLTAPANTAFMYCTAYAVLPVGGVTVGGEAAWFDAYMVNDGPVALPYFDGSTPDDGWVKHAWTGPINLSTSTELPVDPATPIRQKLAAAASIPGVSVAPWYRQTTKPLEGMVRLERVAYPNRLGGINTWQVLIVLPQDIATAERWLDLKIPALAAAVGQEMTVSSIAPQELVTDGGKVPVVVITGNRETE